MTPCGDPPGRLKPALPEIRLSAPAVPKLLPGATYAATAPTGLRRLDYPEDVRRSFAANALLVLILFVVPIIAVFVVPLVLRWAHLVPPAAK